MSTWSLASLPTVQLRPSLAQPMPLSRSTFIFAYDQAAHWNDVNWASTLTLTLITGARFSYPVSGVTTGNLQTLSLTEANVICMAPPMPPPPPPPPPKCELHAMHGSRV